MFNNPLAEARWLRFKANKRGFISLWIFTILFGLSLFAEIIANDKPLLVSYDNQWFVPVINEYSETEFGGEFETEADYKDPYVIELIEDNGYIVWPIIPFSYDTINFDISGAVPSEPDSVNWLGTDDKGRDVLARIIYGFRISVLFGFILTIVSSVVGVVVGATQGYYGGWVDLFGQRFIEVWSGMPTLFLLIILSSFIEPNFWWLLGIMVLFSWMSLVGIVRAEFLRCRNFDYVRAAQAMGVDDKRIMLRHMLPNAMVASLTMMPFILSGSVTTLTSLDFLGFGLPAGSPSLGELLAQGKANLQAPWLGISAFVVLSLMLTLLVFVGEAVRDAFDPHQQK
ncbi:MULTISPECIES: ABC transporter permease [Vibrio]|uniref:ABC transporter permease n=2 Tax=Vibrio cyclitrophicus TaxID=47951 RepID=A0A7Z1S2Y7_9VIBR|nr:MULTISPECIES: ABC transporter permease [Vibrio]KNH12983.1 ABC transporter permease [Vibrio lentus]MBY7660515.1 ABC transporter permease [Vibrio atlanticus]ERM57457.1 Oligopeptide transport system permease protein OppC [Vibrio cyclitrophicus FF75]KAA8601137.1 ABC transporter permease protein YejE [Vibrio cyclitrophicus]MBE8557445.1 ABC transporter permease [Vibrio sp. OPT24]|tara:strand:+ start:1392 stop:2414 length:1023 start_codon:yes stop_codon:yes gene_type:complete